MFLDKSFCDDGVSFEKKIREVVVDTQMPKNRRNTALFIYYMSYLLSYSFCGLYLSISLSFFISLSISRRIVATWYRQGAKLFSVCVVSAFSFAPSSEETREALFLFLPQLSRLVLPPFR